MFNLDLPSGRKVTFRAPSFADRRNILREYDRSEGYLPEDLLAAKCLTHINGGPVEEEWARDPISLMDDWALNDQAYYMEVFMNMFSLDEKAKTAAQEQAKKLMGGAATGGTAKLAKASKLTA